MLPDAIRKEGERLRGELVDAIQAIDAPGLREAALQYPMAGGKGVRPALAVLSYRAAGGEGNLADPLALSVELLHTFSLVHDDLMDHDEVRRGVQTVHTAYGEPTAILAGDALYSLAFEVLTRLEDEPAAMEVVGDVARTARKLCEGQHLDMRYEQEWPSVGGYEAMISKKTAALFQCAAGNAARLAGAEGSLVTSLKSFGHALGMGFQIQDDVLDLEGDEASIGKPVASDVRARKKTHPILVAHERTDEASREVLEDILGTDAPDDEDVEWVLRLVRETGALSRSRERAKGLLMGARGRLAGLPPSQAKQDLEALLDWLEERDR